jgi:predicted porin
VFDAVDSMPAGAKAVTSNTALGSYSDGDADEANGIRYTSPSIAGFNVGLSSGDNNTTDRTTSMAIKGSIAGVGVAMGKVDQQGTAGDDTFMTLGYSVAGVSLGYGNYDSDGNGESTVLGLNTSFAGLNLGFEQEDWDGGSSTDQDQTSFSVNKDLGGMGVTLIYTDTDDGTGVDDQNWTVFYSVGF